MIISQQAHLHPAAITHPGMSGKNNEDQYAISAYTLSEEDPTPVVFAIVADGIGGHRSGEVASEIAVNTISATVAESDGSEPLQTLIEGIKYASTRIREQSNAEASKQGMGSTCVCALIIGEKLYIASVGDSRIYLLREGRIQPLTTDHTWVQEAIEHGIINKEEAQGHPRRHVIHRYLGSTKEIEVDTRLRLTAEESDQDAQANQGTHLLPSDQLLLCCDGLTDVVSDEEIFSIAQETPNQEEALENMVDLANERGGPDNITIISLLVPETVPAKVEQEKSKKKPKKGLWFPLLALGVLVLVNLIGLVMWVVMR